MTVTVYSKPSCVQCTATKKALERKGVEYRSVDVSEDTDSLAFIEGLGYRQVPVVVVNDDHWSGFRPDFIDQLAA